MAGMRLVFYGLSFAIWLIIVALPVSHLHAISPEEQLSDPVLEERARMLSGQLRCLVCQNQSIEDSDAELAQDLRREVRSQILDGKADSLILEDLRNRYGDYILLNPPFSAATYLLWGAPICIVIFGFALFWIYRRPSYQSAKQSLSEASDMPHTNYADTAASDSTGTTPPAIMMVGLVVLILIISTTLYSQFGSPELPAKPLDGRADEIANALNAQTQEIQHRADALKAAKQTAEAHPDSVDNWLALAMAAARAQNSDIEIEALRTALELTDNNISVTSMLAEAMTRKADGLVTLRVRALIDEVLSKNPEEPRALYLSGLAAFQDEAYGLAIERWQTLRQISTADAPWRELVDENIQQAANAGGINLPPPENTAAPLLSAEQMEAVASMSAEEQQAFIISMVDQLEDRLIDSPDDISGWQRLVRARKQLGDRVAILRALEGAAKADQNNPASYLEILEFLLSEQIMPANLPQAETVLARFRQLAPDRLEGLFFAGHIAQLRGDTQNAIAKWQKLLSQLDKDSPLIPLLTSRLEALR